MSKDTKSVFDRDEFEHFAGRWNARLKKLKRRRAYYTGDIYKDTLSALAWLKPTFQRQIKPLVMPIARAVDVDVGIVPRGWRFPTEPSPDAILGGSEPDPEVVPWIMGRDRLFQLSKWKRRGPLYVHWGAQYGSVGLKVVDDRQAGIVRMFPVNPENFMLVEQGQYDLTPARAFWIEHRTDTDGRYEYAEVIEPRTIRTFRNGQPASFEGREAQYTNLLGFVPIIEVPHIEAGESMGESTFGKVIPMLDTVNEQATHLASIIQKHNEPQWVVFGAEESDLVKSGDTIWYFPEGSSVEPLVPDVDIGGMLEFIRESRRQVEGSLPELAFEDLKQKSNVATATVELQLAELVIKVDRIRPNYDEGLADGLRMAGRAAESMENVEALEAIRALNDPMLALDDNRPILPLDPITQLEIETKRRELQRGEEANE